MMLTSPFEIPHFVVPEVRLDDIVAIMEIMQDPNPIHTDEALAAELGFRGCVNQGPANVAYVTNMLISWAGSPTAVRRLNVRLQSISCPGDRLESRGTVTSIEPAGDACLAHCTVELVRMSGEDLRDGDEESILRGTAEVHLSTTVAESVGYVSS